MGRGEGASTIRLRFRKSELARFLSHRDLLRTFERSLRRSALPLEFTRGFNPHPKITVRPAMALGVSAALAPLEIGFREILPVGFVLETLNSQLPEGIRVLDGVVLDSGKPSPIVSVVWSFPGHLPVPPPPMPAPVCRIEPAGGRTLVWLTPVRGNDPPGAFAISRLLWGDETAAGNAFESVLQRVDFLDGQ